MSDIRYSVRDQLDQLREDVSTDLCAAAAMLLIAPTALDHAERAAAVVRAHQLLVAIDAVIAEWPGAGDIEALSK
jgi:tagatose-1,6-bisphosphate aldolase